jgi:hypothetical protein
MLLEEFAQYCLVQTLFMIEFMKNFNSHAMLKDDKHIFDLMDSILPSNLLNICFRLVSISDIILILIFHGIYLILEYLQFFDLSLNMILLNLFSLDIILYSLNFDLYILHFEDC